MNTAFTPLKILLSVFFICGISSMLYAEIPHGLDQAGESIPNQVKLYFFWSKTCPHCERAKPFVEKLGNDYEWLTVSSHEITESPENVKLFRDLTEKLGEKITGVPAFIFCETMIVGYDQEETSGKKLLAQLAQCHELLGQKRVEEKAFLDKPMDLISVPYFGEIDPTKTTLPLFTAIIAGLDAFNPCAFFVLLLLLSLIANVQNRKRVLLIGGIFVFFSGFVYFIFMAAWLNLFLILGELKQISSIAAVLAIGIALINIKDYFWFKQGVSLTIPEGAKPALYRRIRLLANTSSYPVLFSGTVVLAILANSYELLCTAGFPMVFTRVLTLHNLSPFHYYLYLVFYNIVYVIPLALIVLGFAMTLGSRKLSEEEARILKLVSGIMMLGLGLLLWFTPELLSNALVAVGLLGGALLLACIIKAINR